MKLAQKGQENVQRSQKCKKKNREVAERRVQAWKAHLKWLLISRFSIIVMLGVLNTVGCIATRNKKNIPLEAAGTSMELRGSRV